MAESRNKENADEAKQLPPTDYDLFDSDPKERVEEILDEMNVNNDLRSRRDLLKSIRKQNG